MIDHDALDAEYGTDAELEAECRVIGTLLADPGMWERFPAGLPTVAFCHRFHAAVYHQIATLILCDLEPEVGVVWRGVKHATKADDYGPQHIAALVSAASPHTYPNDCAVLMNRAARRCRLLALATDVEGAMQ